MSWGWARRRVRGRWSARGWRPMCPRPASGWPTAWASPTARPPQRRWTCHPTRRPPPRATPGYNRPLSRVQPPGSLPRGCPRIGTTFPPHPPGGRIRGGLSAAFVSDEEGGGEGRVLEGLDDREGIEHGRVLLLIKSFLFFVRVSFLIEEEGEEEEEERCWRKGRFLGRRVYLLEAYYIIFFLWERTIERREYRNLFLKEKKKKGKKKKKKSHSAPPCYYIDV